MRKKEEGQGQTWRCDNGSRGQNGTGSGAEECGLPLEAEKDKGTDSPLEPLEECGLAQ